MSLSPTYTPTATSVLAGAASGCVHAGLDGSTRVIYVEEA